MPRYFFHVDEATGTILDEEGVDLRNEQEARQEAILGVRELMAEALRQGKVLNGRTMRVTDESGREVTRVAFRDVLRLE